MITHFLTNKTTCIFNSFLQAVTDIHLIKKLSTFVESACSSPCSQKTVPKNINVPSILYSPLVSSYEHFQAQFHIHSRFTMHVTCHGMNCEKHTTKYFYWNSVQEYTSVISWFIFHTRSHRMSQTLQLYECFSLVSSTNSGKMYFSLVVISADISVPLTVLIEGSDKSEKCIAKFHKLHHMQSICIKNNNFIYNITI